MKVFIFSFLIILLWSCSKTEEKKVYVPNLPGYLTLKGDFHLHTVFSDGKVWPTTRVDEAVEEGLDVIAITDHIEHRRLLRLIPRDHNLSYRIARPYAKKKNILLVKGTEINQRFPPGHFNALFINDAEALDKRDFKEAVTEAKRQGAFIIWNHPGLRSNDPVVSKWFDIHSWLYENRLMNGIEIYNHAKYYEKAFGWVLEKNLTVFSNTDNHHRTDRDYDLVHSHRPITLVFVKEKSIDGVKEAFIAGRTASLVGQMVRGKEEWLRPLFHSCVTISKKGKTVIIENQSDIWIDLEPEASGGATRILLKERGRAVVEQGGTIRFRVLNFEIGPGENLIIAI